MSLGSSPVTAPGLSAAWLIHAAPVFGGWHERSVLVERRAGGAASATLPEGPGQAAGGGPEGAERHPHVLRNGLRWQDAPDVCGPHRTLHNRFAQWSRLGVFARIFRDLAKPGADGDAIMLDSTHLKAHRTAASLLKKGMFPVVSGAPKAG